MFFFFFFSSRRRHTRWNCDWSSDVCSSDLGFVAGEGWRKVEEIAKRASLVLLLIVVLVAGIVLAGRWIAQHPERVRAAIRRQLERPAVARLRARYERQLAFLARRLRPGGALGLSLTLGLLAIGLAGWAFGAVLQDVLA